MSLQDVSGKDSPLQVTGRVLLRLNEAERFPFSFQLEYKCKNISNKSVLLAIVDFETKDTGSAQLGMRSQLEYLFGHMFEPGTTDSQTSTFTQGISIVNGVPMPIQKPKAHPVATVRVQFVQFSDGSTWGDSDAARDVLGTREKTLAELDLLEHLYEQAGEDIFRTEIEKADATLSCVDGLKYRCKNESDSQCLQKGVHSMLLIAREHEASTKSGASLAASQ